MHLIHYCFVLLLQSHILADRVHVMFVRRLHPHLLVLVVEWSMPIGLVAAKILKLAWMLDHRLVVAFDFLIN